MSTYRVCGLDLGKSIDFTALTLLQWSEWQPGAPPIVYNVPALRRWPLGTSYVELSAWMVKFFRSFTPSPIEPLPLFVVDETGVGVAVVEMIREALIDAKLFPRMVAVTITGGSQANNFASGRWRVAKKQLASTLVKLFQSHRIAISNKLPEAATLVKEAQNFSVKITPAGNETFESWREGTHDDLVLSLALACWAAENIGLGGEIQTSGNREKEMGITPLGVIPGEEASMDRESRPWYEKL